MRPQRAHDFAENVERHPHSVGQYVLEKDQVSLILRLRRVELVIVMAQSCSKLVRCQRTTLLKPW
jgi:hypothetical protein